MSAVGPAVALATPDDWRRFLRPLVVCVTNPPSERDFAAKVAAIAYAMADTPRELLTEWRRAEAMRRFKFFPVPQEVAEWLAPDIVAWRKHTAPSEAPRLAREAPAPQQPTRTPAEIEHVRRVAEALRREMAGRGQDTRRQQDRPRYLTPRELRVARELAGITIAEDA